MPSANEIPQAEVEYQRTLLDEQISRVENVRAALCSRRNVLSKSAMLVAEVLADIFSYCVVSGTVTPREWLRITHVCRHWRSVAVAIPTLWTTIRVGEGYHADLVERMLMRSQSMPIQLRFQFGVVDVDFPHALLGNEFFQQAHRVREVVISALHSGSTESFNSNHAMFTNLESLKVSFSPYHPPQISDKLLSPSFLGGVFPALRRLKLHQCAFPWASPIMSGLTHLVLYNIGSNAPEAKELWAMLSRVPKLRVLTLSNIMVQNGGAPASWNQRPKVWFPALEHLTIDSLDFAQYAWFIALIDFPPTTHLTLQTFPPYFTPDMPLLPPKVFAPQPFPLELYIRENEDTFRLSIRKFTLVHGRQRCSAAYNISEGTYPCGNRLSFALRSGQGDDDGWPFQAAPLAQLDVRLLIIETTRRSETIPWHDLFVTLSQVVDLKLTLHSHALHDVLGALMPADGTFPLPTLGRFSLKVSQSTDAPSEDALLKLLEEREQAGARRLEVLIGRGWVVSRSCVDELITHAQLVDWDTVGDNTNASAQDPENA
ncbi:hypothetical protein CONPUDRAFT_134605 [Coniophora puteana RWD-64-598 SS2]|uniref:F-box domain-containing protein n=1 Tax=Coniophora puteana (strain RWD-64-598) TaxID=741705 RepID=A0A5M3N0T6_CONPW|nr:uncharacterized protein CONPUDRAFT_134605 [Coniophora puteana RWD-64-598 SS2]EIW84634.1 hypothetical protein CONPUDRAFT_134605 [Coniophora puteana RWD-64-598 SS2]